MSQSYTKGCRDCGQQIRMDQVNGKWAAYELDGSGFHRATATTEGADEDVNPRADGHQT